MRGGGQPVPEIEEARHEFLPPKRDGLVHARTDGVVACTVGYFIAQMSGENNSTPVFLFWEVKRDL